MNALRISFTVSPGRCLLWALEECSVTSDGRSGTASSGAASERSCKRSSSEVGTDISGKDVLATAEYAEVMESIAAEMDSDTPGCARREDVTEAESLRRSWIVGSNCILKAS